MADSKVSALIDEALSTSNNDWMYVASWNGVNWTSKKIKPDNVGGKNFANANLTLTGNRSHDGDSNRLTMAKFKDMTFETFIAPTLGLASLNFNGYGTSASDLTHDFNSDNGYTLKMYGDNTAQFSGLIGVNGLSPSAGYGINTTGTTAGVRAVGGNYGIVAIGTTASVFAPSTAGYGVYGATSTGIGVVGEASTSGVAIKGDGAGYFEEYGLGAGMSASALFQLNSTVRGFLPPRMTTTEVNAISSPAIGLMVYNTTLDTICFRNSTGWRKVTDSAM